MKVEKNKVVSLSYQLVVEGQVADKAGADSPLEYIHGTGMLLPKFESEVEGKEVGEEFAFTLTPEEGYGVYDPQMKIDLPKSAFEVNGTLREDLLVPGFVIPMLNSEGQVVQGRVDKVGEETVTMDFNHPMAGKTLNFSGRVERVREASEKELKEGLHGEYLPREEGCHCSGGCHGEGECHKDGGCEGDCDGKGSCCSK